VAKKLWILTEERPKKEVLGQILTKFTSSQGIAAFFDTLRIIPVLSDEFLFTSTYKIVGVTSPAIQDIFLKIVSGQSSFVDYLVFFQDTEPREGDRPLFAIEETKTDDAESRNTGVFQRATKFVYIDVFYPEVDTTMLYNLQVAQKESPTPTNVFGTKCFRTLGVNLMGKTDSVESLDGWSSVDELIAFRASMRRPPAGNVPILVEKVSSDLITVSGRLVKAGSLSHDPNIGALSLIGATLRKLGWDRRIQIIQHGLSQKMVRPANKFVQIANHLRLEVEGIEVPVAKFPENYWRYESTGEKLGTIFAHLAVEEFSEGFAIYENHAGCERGYFYTAEGVPLAVGKRLSDSNGFMSKEAEKISIPDLLIIDVARLQVINIEGERAQNVEAGIQQLDTFANFEETYLKRYYPNYEVMRTVVLYGGSSELVEKLEVSLLVNQSGRILLGVQAPMIFRETIQNLISFWKSAH
jgi:hypothetical protein